MKTNLLILIITFAIFSLGCRKKNNQTTTPSRLAYTSRMGGSRIWHGTKNGTNIILDSTPIQYIPYLHYITDTLTVTVINDTAVNFSGNTYLYDAPGATSETISFKYIGSSDFSVLTYYFLADSIHYYDSTFIPLASAYYYPTITKLSTP